MVDESKAPETGTEQQAETQVIDKAETVEELKARLEEAERRAKNKAEEAERHFRKLTKLEQEEAKRKEAEMTEIELANKRAQELEAKVRQLEISRLQHDIAAKVGLPAIYADRLKGETPEELEADAKLLRGYSWETVIDIYSNNMKTVNTTKIVARRMSDYVGDQQ